MSVNLDSQEAVERETRTAVVSALAYSKELINKIGKEPHESAEITKYGIPGDYHYGETRYSSSQKKTLMNDRPLTVVGAEAADAAAERLGVPPIKPGGLGENIQLTGAGDLSDLASGDEIHFFQPDSAEPDVILEVGIQNPPCSSLMIYHKQMPKELMGRRGVTCIVLKEGRVSVGTKAVIKPKK